MTNYNSLQKEYNNLKKINNNLILKINKNVENIRDLKQSIRSYRGTLTPNSKNQPDNLKNLNEQLKIANKNIKSLKEELDRVKREPRKSPILSNSPTKKVVVKSPTLPKFPTKKLVVKPPTKKVVVKSPITDVSDHFKKKIYLVGEKHNGYDILGEIKTICKKYPDIYFHIFTEMSLSHDISSNTNITIIPEILYFDSKPDMNIRNMMFFLINTFVYMKVYLEALEDKSDLDLTKKDENLNTKTGVPIKLGDIDDYFTTALKSRMKEKFFGAKYKNLYDNLEYFFKNYEKKDLVELKKSFKEIIEICCREKIFEPILKLNTDYIQKDNDKQNLINIEDKYDLTFDRPELNEKDEVIQGWSFLTRDIYHLNFIKQYFNLLPNKVQEKSVIIIHKGFLHFSSDVFKYSERSFFLKDIKKKDKDEIDTKIQNIISRL